MSFNKLIAALFFAGIMSSQQMYVSAASSAPQNSSAHSQSVSTDANASGAKKTEQKAEAPKSSGTDVSDLYEDDYVAPTPLSLARAGEAESKTERATTPILHDVAPAPAEEKFSQGAGNEEDMYFNLADRRELQEAEQQAAAFAEFNRAHQVFFEVKEPVKKKNTSADDLIDDLTNQARYGNVRAAYLLGSRLIRNGVAASPGELSQGMSWFERAATGGHAPSCRELAKCYQNSAQYLANRTADQCVAEVKKWTALAAEYEAKASATTTRSADLSEATEQTAITGSSTSSPSSASASSRPYSPDLDLKTLQENAARGKRLAQCALGKKLFVQGDVTNGRIWLEKAAEQGVFDAHCWLCFSDLSSINVITSGNIITERLKNAAQQRIAQLQRSARAHYIKAATLCKSEVIACETISAIYQQDATQEYERNAAHAWQRMADCHRIIAELPDVIETAIKANQTALVAQQKNIFISTKKTRDMLELQIFGAPVSSEVITAHTPSNNRTAKAEDDEKASTSASAKRKAKRERYEKNKRERDQKAKEEKAQKEAAAKAALEEQRQKTVKAAQALFDELQKTATQAAATADTAEAQHKLSQIYQRGNEAIAADEKQALTWLQTACKTAQVVAQQRITPYETAMQRVVLASIDNNMRITIFDANNDNDIQSALADAQLYLAIKYEHGIGGVTQNAVRAAELYQQIVKNSDSANTWYAIRHHRAISSETKMASEWYAKAPQQKNPLALYDQAQLCHLDDKNPRSLEMAFALYQEVAKGSYEKECKQMAEAYNEIPGLVSVAKTLCSINDHEAAKKIGYIPAWYNLGKALEANRPDQSFAAQLIAARCGNPNAQHQLALWYENGNARPYIARNKPTAFAWYLLAAEQGLPEAQCHLGTCYLNGNGVNADATQAVRWYTIAAPHNIDAAYELGCRYEHGTGVAAVDLNQAIRLYTSAAEHGHVPSMNKLVTYYRGQGANATLAERWQQCAQAATKKMTDEKKDAENNGRDEKKTALAADNKDEEKEESANIEELSSKEKGFLASTPCITMDANFKEALNSDGLRRNKATIMQHITDFCIDPLNNTLDIKKLKGFANVLRIRSGDYRIFIIMQVIGDMVIYHIDTVVLRGDAYRPQVLARIEKKAQELNKKS